MSTAFIHRLLLTTHFSGFTSPVFTIRGAVKVSLWVGLPQNPVTPRRHVDSHLAQQGSQQGFDQTGSAVTRN